MQAYRFESGGKSMSNEHTPGNLFLRKSTHGINHIYAEGQRKPLASVKAEANAQRLVACWNTHDGLLAAAQYAVRVLAEENAGGTIESKQRMKTAQGLLFKAIEQADPAYYGKVKA